MKKQQGLSSSYEEKLMKKTRDVFCENREIAWVFRIGEPLRPKEYSKRIHRSKFLQEDEIL